MKTTTELKNMIKMLNVLVLNIYTEQSARGVYGEGIV